MVDVKKHALLGAGDAQLQCRQTQYTAMQHHNETASAMQMTLASLRIP